MEGVASASPYILKTTLYNSTKEAGFKIAVLTDADDELAVEKKEEEENGEVIYAHDSAEVEDG